MTTSLPEIRIRPTDSGWLVQCGTCGWIQFALGRDVLDEAGIEHRRRCRRKD